MFSSIINQSLTLTDYVKFSLKSKPSFLALLSPFQTQINFILARLEEMIYLYDIDNLSGKKLDFVGYIVNQPRITSYYSNGNFIFDSGDAGFDQGLFDVGGEYILDDKYKLLLKAKILKNNTKNWARNDVIAYHKALLGDAINFEITEGDRTVDIVFSDPLEPFKQQILNSYPIKIGGVIINYEVPA